VGFRVTEQFLFMYFGFPLSISFHQCPIFLFFIYNQKFIKTAVDNTFISSLKQLLYCKLQHVCWLVADRPSYSITTAQLADASSFMCSCQHAVLKHPHSSLTYAYCFSARKIMFGVTKLRNGVLPESLIVAQVVIIFLALWQHEFMLLGHIQS